VNSTPKVMMPTVVMTPTVMIWGLEKGNVLCRIQTFKVMSRAVAFSPDSQYLLAGSQGAPTDRSGELILYNVKTCDEVRRFTTDKDVSSIVFSADGRYALTGSAFNSQATLWDVSTGQEINQYTYPAIAPVLGAVFGPSETTILASGEPDMHLWDLSSGELIRTYLGHSTITWGVAISPDGKYVLGGTLMGDVTLWDYATGKELSRFTLLKEADSFTFSPDSKTAYVTSVDGRLTEWRIAERSLPELLDWIKANRYVRELTCPEKLQYSLVDTKCK
jgi:WD40 repeat protein